MSILVRLESLRPEHAVEMLAGLIVIVDERDFSRLSSNDCDFTVQQFMTNGIYI